MINFVRFASSKSKIFAVALLSLTLALTVHSVERNVPFAAAFYPPNSSAHPYSGEMTLNFNHGAISGTYTDTSVKPNGPLYNRRNVGVSGGINASGAVTLLIGSFSFNGTLEGQVLSGIFRANGRTYTFKAHQRSGHP